MISWKTFNIECLIFLTVLSFPGQTYPVPLNACVALSVLVHLSKDNCIPLILYFHPNFRHSHYLHTCFVAQSLVLYVKRVSLNSVGLPPKKIKDSQPNPPCLQYLYTNTLVHCDFSFFVC